MCPRRVLAWAGWGGVTAVTVRGATGSRHALASLAWLARSQPPQPSPPAGQDRCLVVIVPLLREQRLIASTVTAMTQLAAGWGHASVVLATTEREHADRQIARARLPHLALAVSRGQPTSRFLGVFPQDRLDALAVCAGRPAAYCLQAVRQEFGRLEPTPEMAAQLAARDDWPVPVRHYHLPDRGGTMASQVNHAAAAELARLTADGIDPVRIWLALYNADSRPAARTLPALAGLLDACPD